MACREEIGDNIKLHPESVRPGYQLGINTMMMRSITAEGRVRRSKDPHLPQYPSIIRLHNIHNHNLFVADALRHRDVGDKAIEMLTRLFEIGHSPTSALLVLKNYLHAEYGEKYVYASADREICPDLQFCYRLYTKVFRQKYGERNGPEMVAALERQVEEYNHKCIDTCAKVKTSSGGTPIVAVLSPLMKRVHLSKHSGELCFIDSSGNSENCPVFLPHTHTHTHTCAGGLPLGVILTQSEDEATIFEGLELFKELMKDDAFAGRGQAGPHLFLTDDSKAERGALGRAFPEATLLLCAFDLLQAVWRLRWSKEHGINMKDRQALFTIVKDILYAREMPVVEQLYQLALVNPVAVRYRKFMTYLEKLYSCRESWALRFRENMPTHGNDTNNYVEAALRVFKDKILQRTKAFNLPRLFELLPTGGILQWLLD